MKKYSIKMTYIHLSVLFYFIGGWVRIEGNMKLKLFEFIN